VTKGALVNLPGKSPGDFRDYSRHSPGSSGEACLAHTATHYYRQRTPMTKHHGMHIQTRNAVMTIFFQPVAVSHPSKAVQLHPATPNTAGYAIVAVAADRYAVIIWPEVLEAGG
jgi:hypothetical protein